MWRASLEILDFVPLATVDYSGGVIITDWYSDDLNSDETIKIIVNFLSNEIRADGLKIKLYKKKCNQNQICKTQLLSSKINNEIKLAILKKAAQIKAQDTKKKAKDSDYKSSQPKIKLNRYNFKVVEEKWQNFWIKNKSFQSETKQNKKKVLLS